MEPRIVTDPRTGRGIITQPFGDAGLGYALVVPEPAIDLIADLQGIAAIDKHCRRIL